MPALPADRGGGIECYTDLSAYLQPIACGDMIDQINLHEKHTTERDIP